MGNITQLEPATEQRDLRAAFQIELEQSGLSAARAADQIGRHASSITRWLNGTYTGDNEAVAADVERWLDTRADTAKRSLDGAGLDRHAGNHRLTSDHLCTRLCPCRRRYRRHHRPARPGARHGRPSATAPAGRTPSIWPSQAPCSPCPVYSLWWARRSVPAGTIVRRWRRRGPSSTACTTVRHYFWWMRPTTCATSCSTSFASSGPRQLWPGAGGG